MKVGGMPDSAAGAVRQGQGKLAAEGKTEEDSDIRGQRHPPVIGSRPRPKNRPMNF